MSDTQHTPEETAAEEREILEETATTVFGEPQTVVESDADDVDWKAAAESLQIELDKREVYPREDGDFIVLGPEIFTDKEGSVLNWKGVNYVPQKVNLQPKDLKRYSVSDRVETIVRGDWIPGIVSSKQPGILNVDTERGPVSVASYHKIRRVAQDG